MSQPIALLIRGLNVGAHNRMTMKELVGLLEHSGFESVGTYLQSGNVRLQSNRSPSETATCVEKVLEDHFQKKLVVVARDWVRLMKVVELEPFSEEDTTHHRGIAIFLKEPRDGAEHFMGEHGSLRILHAENDMLIGLVREGQTHTLDFKKLIEKPLGTPVTARFWNVIEDWVRKYE